MEIHFQQIEKALEHNLFYIALHSALTLPSICGAMESENGIDSGNKYRTWFDKWVAPKYYHPPLKKITVTGGVCYSFRNGMLHQGRNNHKDLGFSKLAFTEPGPVTMHNQVSNDTLCLDLTTFVNDVLFGGRDWLRHVQNDEYFKNNYKFYMRRYEKGIPSIGLGFPLIG